MYIYIWINIYVYIYIHIYIYMYIFKLRATRGGAVSPPDGALPSHRLLPSQEGDT